MKKTVILAVLSVAASAVILCKSISTAKTIDNVAVTSPEKTVQKYILKDYNGRIAVFYDGSEIPNEIFEIYTRTLPQEDAEKIEKGIEIDGISDLTDILTDYTS